MKLARIILPERDSNNELLVAEHQVLQRRLIDRYNGYTQTKGSGGWRSSTGKIFKEPVFIYDVAMERADAPSLRALAANTAFDANQECVMIVTPCGDVEFVKPLDHTA